MKCYNGNKGNLFYFNFVIKYCIDFLIEHPIKTIILHLKKEDIDEKKIRMKIILMIILLK